jgi:hypothetical protein
LPERRNTICLRSAQQTKNSWSRLAARSHQSSNSRDGYGELHRLKFVYATSLPAPHRTDNRDSSPLVVVV